jgi:hypothetical protein
VRGQVHANSIENFWSLLKRGRKGTYVCVEPLHLSPYIDEEALRFNNRKHLDKSPMNDAKRTQTGDESSCCRHLMCKVFT